MFLDLNLREMPLIKPGNIWSGNPNGLAVLTNMTALAKRKGNIKRDYPFVWDDHTYVDLEEAYQTHKRNSKRMSYEDLQKLMIVMLMARFVQQPFLLSFIARNGGVEWLEQCCHIVRARTHSFARWEGRGRESAFILCLIKAYDGILKASDEPCNPLDHFDASQIEPVDGELYSIEENTLPA